MNLPPFVYSMRFWTALSWVVAGLLGLLAHFGVVAESWALPATTILAWVLALLNMFGVKPELQIKKAVEVLKAQGLL